MDEELELYNSVMAEVDDDGESLYNEVMADVDGESLYDEVMSPEHEKGLASVEEMFDRPPKEAPSDDIPVPAKVEKPYMPPVVEGVEALPFEDTGTHSMPPAGSTFDLEFDPLDLDSIEKAVEEVKNWDKYGVDNTPPNPVLGATAELAEGAVMAPVNAAIGFGEGAAVAFSDTFLDQYRALRMSGETDPDASGTAAHSLGSMFGSLFMRSAYGASQIMNAVENADGSTLREASKTAQREGLAFWQLLTNDRILSDEEYNKTLSSMTAQDIEEGVVKSYHLIGAMWAGLIGIGAGAWNTGSQVLSGEAKDIADTDLGVIAEALGSGYAHRAHMLLTAPKDWLVKEGFLAAAFDMLDISFVGKVGQLAMLNRQVGRIAGVEGKAFTATGQETNHFRSLLNAAEERKVAARTKMTDATSAAESAIDQVISLQEKAALLPETERAAFLAAEPKLLEDAAKALNGMWQEVHGASATMAAHIKPMIEALSSPGLTKEAAELASSGLRGVGEGIAADLSFLHFVANRVDDVTKKAFGGQKGKLILDHMRQSFADLAKSGVNPRTTSAAIEASRSANPLGTFYSKMGHAIDELPSEAWLSENAAKSRVDGLSKRIEELNNSAALNQTAAQALRERVKNIRENTPGVAEGMREARAEYKSTVDAAKESMKSRLAALDSGASERLSKAVSNMQEASREANPSRLYRSLAEVRDISKGLAASRETGRALNALIKDMEKALQGQKFDPPAAGDTARALLGDDWGKVENVTPRDLDELAELANYLDEVSAHTELSTLRDMAKSMARGHREAVKAAVAVQKGALASLKEFDQFASLIRKDLNEAAKGAKGAGVLDIAAPMDDLASLIEQMQAAGPPSPRVAEALESVSDKIYIAAGELSSSIEALANAGETAKALREAFSGEKTVAESALGLEVARVKLRKSKAESLARGLTELSKTHEAVKRAAREELKTVKTQLKSAEREAKSIIDRNQGMSRKAMEEIRSSMHRYFDNILEAERGHKPNWRNTPDGQLARVWAAAKSELALSKAVGVLNPLVTPVYVYRAFKMMYIDRLKGNAGAKWRHIFLTRQEALTHGLHTAEQMLIRNRAVGVHGDPYLMERSIEAEFAENAHDAGVALRAVADDFTAANKGKYSTKDLGIERARHIDLLRDVMKHEHAEIRQFVDVNPEAFMRAAEIDKRRTALSRMLAEMTTPTAQAEGRIARLGEELRAAEAKADSLGSATHMDEARLAEYTAAVEKAALIQEKISNIQAGRNPAKSLEIRQKLHRLENMERSPEELAQIRESMLKTAEEFGVVEHQIDDYLNSLKDIKGKDFFVVRPGAPERVVAAVDALNKHTDLIGQARATSERAVVMGLARNPGTLKEWYVPENWVRNPSPADPRPAWVKLKEWWNRRKDGNDVGDLNHTFEDFRHTVEAVDASLAIIKERASGILSENNARRSGMPVEMRRDIESRAGTQFESVGKGHILDDESIGTLAVGIPHALRDINMQVFWNQLSADKRYISQSKAPGMHIDEGILRAGQDKGWVPVFKQADGEKTAAYIARVEREMKTRGIVEKGANVYRDADGVWWDKSKKAKSIGGDIDQLYLPGRIVGIENRASGVGLGFRKYGDVNGMMSPQVAYESVMSARYMRQIEKASTKALSMWKGFQTTLHFGSHSTNIIGSLTMAMHAGLNILNPFDLKYLRRAAVAMASKNKPAWFREFSTRDMGRGPLGSMSRAETNAPLSAHVATYWSGATGTLERFTKEIGEVMVDPDSFASKVLGEKGARNAAVLGSTAKATVATLGELYRANDDTWRAAAYLKKVENGELGSIAGESVWKSFAAYDNLHGGVRVLRNSIFGTPFLAFPTQTVGRVWDSMRTNPVSWSFYTTIGNNLNQVRDGMMTRDYFNTTQDEQYALYKAFGPYFAASRFANYIGPEGVKAVNVNKFETMSGLAGLPGDNPLESTVRSVVGGNPMLGALFAGFGYDLHRGQALRGDLEDLDRTATFFDRLKKITEIVAPRIISDYVLKVKPSAEGRSFGSSSTPQDPLMVRLEYLTSVSLRKYSPEEVYAAVGRTVNSVELKARKYVNALTYELQSGKITPEEFDEKVNQLDGLIDEELKKQLDFKWVDTIQKGIEND